MNANDKTITSTDSLIHSSKYVMYILINNNLKLSKIEIATQIGKITGIIIDEILTSSFTIPNKLGFTLNELCIASICVNITNISNDQKNILSDYCHYMRWKQSNGEIIILKTEEEELKRLIHTEPKCRSLVSGPISTRNVRKTLILPYSLIGVGFFPRNDLYDKMTKYKLL